MITPMRPDGAVNYGEAARLANWLCDRGTTGLVVCGTTGEGPTLRDDEKLRLFETIAGAAGTRAGVIANTGGNDTQRSIEASKSAARCGVKALLLVAPYYNKPPQPGLISHFLSIVEAAGLPAMVYNIPGRTGVNISADSMLALADHPLIVAVKESSGDLAQIGEIARRAPAGFDVYSGDDHLALPTAAVGGCGVVSVASHVAGRDTAAMLDAFFAGDVGAATAAHHRLMPLWRALFAVTSPIPVKAAMQSLGFDVGRCRPPLCELTQAQRHSLDAAIAPWRDSALRH
ncbi:MAG: 4-hydroxy-tetrahydrodipicolinate synthase [Candidatus Eremiobacteraeota bacterium]|nr:4-hydroxy-tetrahydrodipicolinate synthase [Candidatus Eremiobacteraeota bacterium]MBC5827730.1 4-hydroxy-tetrahydrodipicolinate synthase [Candidatus Eremiobacteraeota bacterium]